MLWLTLIHTTKGNGPNLADWSKSVCITPQSCLCSLLASNWELNADLSLNSFLISSEVAKQFIIYSFIEDNETNIPNEKHTLCVLYDNLKKVFAKFDSMLRVWICFNLLQFRVTFNDLCCGLLSCIHLWLTDQNWNTGPNESALHFEVVFVVCWHQIWKLVKVVL